MISRRRLHLVLTLLLPLLVLRALLPAGYMPIAGHDGPRIVMCSAGLATWNAPLDDQSHQRLPHAADDCPFAHAALSAPPPHYVVSGTVPAPEARFLASLGNDLPPATGPPRHAGARAPPAILL